MFDPSEFENRFSFEREPTDFGAGQPDAMESLERLIRAADGYVLPSDELRPLVVEEVRDQSQRRLGKLTLMRSSALAAVVVGLVIVTGQWLSNRPPIRPTMQELNHSALMRAAAAGVDLRWSIDDGSSTVGNGPVTVERR